MKTTIKSFLVAAVAATTLFSCAKEIESPEGAVPGNPGDVQISIGLGGGATTYASKADELKIHEGNAVLYNTGTKAVIPITNVSVTADRFTATVPAAGFESGVTKAKLCIYVNGTITPAAPTTLEAMKAATIAQPLDITLTNGLPAAVETPEVTLTGGVTFSDPYQLKRVAARVGVVTTGESIVDYKVELKKVNITSGKLFPNNLTDTPASDNTAVVTHMVNGTTTGMYKDIETVGYVYPSTASEITVTPATGKGEPKTVAFAPQANKNYTVKITPKVNADGSFNNTITIEAWDAADEDIPVDMNPTKEMAPIVIKDSRKDNFSEYKNGISVKAGINLSSLPLIDLVGNPAGALGIRLIEIATTLAADAPTALNPLSIRTNAPTQSNVIDIATFATPTAEVMKTLKITYNDYQVRYLNIYLQKHESSVEKLLVNIGGNLWMPFNTSGSAAGDEEIAAAILAASGANNTEKIVNYGYANFAQQLKLMGKFFLAVNHASACPAGYTAATMADWNALAGNSTLPTGSNHWCAAPATELTTTQDFQNSLLSRVSKPDISTGGSNKKRNFYYTFTAKAQLGATAGDILPLIGNGWSYSEGILTAIDALGGTIQWIGGAQIGGKQPRIVIWSNGINCQTEDPQNNYVGNVRCVKVK